MDNYDVRSIRGHIQMTVGGVLVYDGPNLVLNIAPEILTRAALGQDSIARIAFADTARTPATPGMRSIPGIVQTLPATRETGRDARGRRAVGIWRAVWPAVADTRYDFLALLTDSMLPFAARSFEPVTLPAGESVAVRWTINFRD